MDTVVKNSLLLPVEVEAIRPTWLESETGTSSISVKLTPTEIEVLTLIALGNSSKEAAAKRSVSKRTVDFHLANIYNKLMVNNRVLAVRTATQLGLISYEP